MCIDYTELEFWRTIGLHHPLPLCLCKNTNKYTHIAEITEQYHNVQSIDSENCIFISLLVVANTRLGKKIAM